MAKYRIVAEEAETGVILNYQVQRRLFGFWFPLGDYSSLEAARGGLDYATRKAKIVEERTTT